MPGERRNLRSSKDTSSETNGETSQSNSQSSSSKDKTVPTRAPSTKGKPTNKADKHPNGEPVENGVNGAEDVDMVDQGVDVARKNEDQMTVVVPPPKSSKLAGDGKDAEGDIAMNEAEKKDDMAADAQKVDPKVKTVTG